MKGSYNFRVRSKKALFEFTIKRNITVLKGESATGKTTLLRMLYEYLLNGKQSGFSVSTDASYFVFLRRELRRSWQETLYPLENTVIFIEENNDFVFTQEFAEFVINSGNYFVLVNRSPFKMLPYSINEIYEIVTEPKKSDVKESYHEFKELYSNYPQADNNKMERIITEDSNSGYEFYSHIFSNREVMSANGNGNVVNKLEKLDLCDTLVIVDGAAFGAMIEECIEYCGNKYDERISIWMPESFEYVLLKAGVIESEQLKRILEMPWEYIDSKLYMSWERYFTDLLIKLSENAHKYSKNYLNEFYLQERNVVKVIQQLPDVIRAGL